MFSFSLSVLISSSLVRRISKQRLTLKWSCLNRLIVEEFSSEFEVRLLLLLSMITERFVVDCCCCCCLPLNAGDDGRRIEEIGFVRFKRCCWCWSSCAMKEVRSSWCSCFCRLIFKTNDDVEKELFTSFADCSCNFVLIVLECCSRRRRFIAWQNSSSYCCYCRRRRRRVACVFFFSRLGSSTEEEEEKKKKNDKKYTEDNANWGEKITHVLVIKDGFGLEEESHRRTIFTPSTSAATTTISSLLFSFLCVCVFFPLSQTTRQSISHLVKNKENINMTRRKDRFSFCTEIFLLSFVVHLLAERRMIMSCRM